jgi:hypothetical protein
MTTRNLAWTVAALVLVGPGLVGAEDAPKPKSHTTRDLEGWTVHIDDRLLAGPDKELGDRAVRLLASRLADIKLVVPADRLARLQKVAIWLDRTCGKLKPAQYHPSSGWLKEHGYDTAMARCVHIPDAAEWAGARHQHVQPWSVMHELAHAYHDQVLGWDDADIKAAYERFVQSGRYKSVLNLSGKELPHYALTNEKEFFAEMTESYLGRNDFYPFNAAELRREEPELFKLLEKIWGRLP